jgi:8-oxo-dGTP pyrophosphatase MutT (NUDIX family)
LASQARHKGRQVGALPITVVAGETRVLLVTSRDTGRWIIPKGWLEPDLSPGDCAAREAFEEAGAVGTLARRPIGSFTYEKRLKDGRSLPCTVGVFPLRVERLLKDWPEANSRQRCWFTLAEAAERLAEAELVALLQILPRPRRAAG